MSGNHGGTTSVSGSKGRAVAVRALRWGALAALLAIIAIAFAETLQSAWVKVRYEPIEISWHLGVSVVLFAAAVPLSGLLWGRILAGLSNRPVPAIEAAAVHTVSWVLKYVPGQVGSLVYKNLWGKRRGYTVPDVTLSFLYENLFLQVASFIPALVILPLYFGADILSSDALTTAALVAASVIAAFIVLGPGLQHLLPVIAKRFPRGEKQLELRTLSLRQCVEYATLFTIPRVLNAAGFVLIVYSIAPIDPDAWLPLGSIYVLAGAIGILAVFVPSGLGVREAVIVLFASNIIGPSEAIVAAVLARLLSVASDGAIVLIYLALRAVQARRAT